jgi:hypothetical protein
MFNIFNTNKNNFLHRARANLLELHSNSHPKNYEYLVHKTNYLQVALPDGTAEDLPQFGYTPNRIAVKLSKNIADKFYQSLEAILEREKKASKVEAGKKGGLAKASRLQAKSKTAQKNPSRVVAQS